MSRIFSGPTGASRLIGLADSRPMTPAAAVFPSAARANPTIFYDGRGNARSAGDVYRNLIGRYDVARSGPANPPANPPATVADTAAPSAPRTGFAPDTASLTETYAAAARLSPTVQAAETGPVFYGLFRSTGGPEPIAPLVNSLWTSPTASAGAIKPAPVEPRPGPLRRPSLLPRRRPRAANSACSRTSSRCARAVPRPGLIALGIG